MMIATIVAMAGRRERAPGYGFPQAASFITPASAA